MLVIGQAASWPVIHQLLTWSTIFHKRRNILSLSIRVWWMIVFHNKPLLKGQSWVSTATSGWAPLSPSTATAGTKCILTYAQSLQVLFNGHNIHAGFSCCFGLLCRCVQQCLQIDMLCMCHRSLFGHTVQALHFNIRRANDYICTATVLLIRPWFVALLQWAQPVTERLRLKYVLTVHLADGWWIQASAFTLWRGCNLLSLACYAPEPLTPSMDIAVLAPMLFLSSSSPCECISGQGGWGVSIKNPS